MTSTLDAPRSVLLGDQRPRIASVPPSGWSEGDRAADLAEAVGLKLDDWERWVLDQGLGRDDGGQWTAFEKALIVSRQNGKGAVLEALELAALFLDDFGAEDRKSTRLNSSHVAISYAVFCWKKKKQADDTIRYKHKRQNRGICEYSPEQS